ncbi:beta-porphyranase A-like [Haliotis asinina]|uniref:beta-porphyranase A-like n=1 Tax=Haliotis asinina TaxID=109174 RepID=UPI0035320736
MLIKIKWTLVYVTLSLAVVGVYSDTTVTIYPQWLAQGGSVRYDSNRWNKHNSLDHQDVITKCRNLRTDAGRWNNNGLRYQLFADWPEDPNRSGYPDPNYLKNVTKQKEVFSVYLDNINSGYENDMIMMSEGLSIYPSWMNQSEHAGQFPNNIDAAAEFMMLMVQGVYDFTNGRIPPYIEPMNEPDPKYKILNLTTAALFHKLVAEKIHSKFNMKVAGPTLDGYARNSDQHSFATWKAVANFMDITRGYIDVFSFHSYNALIVSGKSHKFTGMNEARLVAFVDLVESYAYQTTGKLIPLVISEYGRGKVEGISKTDPSPIVDFATIYHANAHRFTHLGLREYIDRSVAFLIARVGYPFNNWSLFTRQGQPNSVVDVYKFWYKFNSDYSFIRTTSQYDEKQRIVSPLAMSSTRNNETVILLHSYSQKSQNVKLDFKDDWIKPTTGEATCVTIKDDWYPVITFNVTFDIQKTQGIVDLPPEATCHFTFKTPSDQLPKVTLNETTYYGSDILIPVKGNIAMTVISLPKAQYESARLRVAASWPDNEINIVSYITFNNHRLDSYYQLFDANMIKSTTYWEVWEFVVPTSLFVSGANQVQVYFSNNMTGGHVSSVALVTAELASSDFK